MNRAIREASRTLLRSPAFTATAVISVGAAVGSAGSVFAVAYATFFARMPYPEADRLVEIWQTTGPASAQASDYLQPARMRGWVGMGARHLAAVAGSGMGPILIVDGTDPPERVDSAPIVGDWFGVMRVPAARGRVLDTDDARPGAEPAVVVSERLAREHALDLGSTIRLSGTAYVLVGIMPPEFESRARVWMAEESLPATSRPVAYAGVARIADGSSLEEAVAEIQQMAAAEVAADSAAFAGLGATARAFGSMARRPEKPRLWMLAGVVTTVVLVGLSNLTQLFLIRGQRRSRGLAVRAALGGDSWQIGRGLVAEGVLVGAIGGALGLALTAVGKDAARAILGGDYALSTRPSLGLPVVAFALALTVFVSVMISVEPLRRLRRLDLQGLLQRRSAGSTTTKGERRSQRAMVAVQVAMSVVLVAVAAVFGSAYRSLHALELGYSADSVVQAVPDYELARMEVPAQWEMARIVAARLRGRPGIDGVGVWESVGMNYPPRPDIEAVFDAPTRELGPFERLYVYYAIDPGFFGTLGVEVIAGRELSEADGAGAPPVALVTRKGADAWWPGEDPLGRQMKLGQDGAWMTVVGVTEDIASLDQLGPATAMQGRHRPFVFVPSTQVPVPPVGWRSFSCCAGVMVGVRPAGSVGLAAEMLRSELADVAPGLPVEVGTMTSLQVTDSYAGSSIALTGRLVVIGTLVALLLALFGVVGVVAEALSRRTRDIGVRRALGATTPRVVAATAREVATTVGLGIGVGLMAVVVLDRTLSGVVFDYYVQRLTAGVLDPAALATAMALVAGAATLTAVVAARRAAAVDPAVALRSE